MAAKKKSAGTKLAEALLLRADVQKKVASLRERIVANAVVQDGDKPSEDPNVLLLEVSGVLLANSDRVRRASRARRSATRRASASAVPTRARTDRRTPRAPKAGAR